MADDSQNIVDFASGLPTVSQAATAALPQNPIDLGARLVQQLTAARGGFPGGSMIPGATPASPMMPQPPMKVSPEGVIPQGPFGTVGERKRADTQAIFNNISGIVNQAKDRFYQQKVEKLKLKFDTMGKAIQGINEGKATGNQEMIKHNTRIINEMMSDPKTAKEMAKAFDINLNPLAEQKGKGKQKQIPEQDAMRASFAEDLKNFQADKSGTTLSPQANAMMRAMPQNLQADPRYQQYLEGLKAGAFPKAGEILTFGKGVMEVQEKINANQLTNEVKTKMSENLGKAMMDRTMMQQYGAMIRTQIMQLGAEDRANIMADALKYRADQTLKGQTDRTNVLREKLQGSTSDYGKKLLVLMKGLDDAAKKNSKDLEDAKKNHDTERMQYLVQQADGIAFQQRLVNDKAQQQVGIDMPTDESLKGMGLSDSERALYLEIFKDQTQPSGEENPPED